MTDVRRALRRIRPQRSIQPLLRRSRSELPFVSGTPAPGRTLLLDSCVYIDVLRERSPPEVDALLRLRSLMHLSTCVAELAHLLGRLDPAHPGMRAVMLEVEQAITGIRPHRLEAAGTGVIVEAGVLAGLLFRLGGAQKGREVAALNDATVFLHALARGYTVLTRNVRDFDLMNQILPEGRVLFYEQLVPDAVATSEQVGEDQG